MKTVQTFDQFLNESQKMSFDDVADQYMHNPYGIGASRIELETFVGQTGNRILIFRTEDDRQRNVVMQNLKDMGFPAKKMTKSTADRGYKYRYEVNLFESEDMNEAFHRLPEKTIGNELYTAKQSLNAFFDRVNSGNDVEPAVLKSIISKLEKVEKEIKSFSKAEDVKGTVYEGEANEAANHSAKWPLTDKIDSSSFYNMWASLDVAAQNLSDYMDDANKGKEKDALFSLKVAYDELTDLMKSKAIEKQLKAMEAELKEKNALR